MANQIQGKVNSIDESGKLISDISNEQVVNAPTDDSLRVKFGDHETAGLFHADHEHPAATMVAFLGNSGFIEIEIVGISLSEMLGVAKGEPVTISW